MATMLWAYAYHIAQSGGVDAIVAILVNAFFKFVFHGWSQPADPLTAQQWPSR
jgi:hypothetical protein